jgi:hypothetical protein
MTLEQEKHIFGIGDSVFRVRWDRIEEGVVSMIRRVSFDGLGNYQEDLQGDHIETIAVFGTDRESQTFCWKFFPTLELARERFRVLALRQAKDLEHSVQEWRKKSESYIAKKVDYKHNDQTGRMDKVTE